MSDLIQELISKDLKSYLENYEGHKFQRNMTICPFHDDKNPSMSVDQKDGAGLFHCHACGAGGNIIRYIMKKHGLKKGEAIKKLAAHFNLDTTPGKPKVIAEYSYTDEKGKELYKVLRFSPKEFRANKKLDGVRQVLYHLPEVIKADRVWLVEGEKDADNMRKLMFTATTAPFGLNHWKPQFSQSLKGKQVMICLDVGAEQEAERRAASILKAGAGAVKIIELPGLEREGQDISDWIELQDSKTFEELHEWLEVIAENTLCFNEIKNEHLTDLGNAMRFARQHSKGTRFCHEGRKWFYFNGIRWEKDNVGEIERKAKKTVRSIYAEASKIKDENLRKERATFALRSESSQKIKAMLSLAESEPEIPILSNDFDSDIYALNVLNGTINLKTGDLKPHKSADLITKLCPVNYDPKEESPLWQKFLNEIMDRNDELISFLQKVIGYSLTGDIKEQCFFIFYGTGANGKTTFLQTISALMNDYAQQSPTETFMIRRFGGVPNDVARLKGTRFVSTIEIEEGRRMAESLVKALTGGDTIAARFLFGEFFEFIPQFKLFLGTNHKPLIHGTDLAIWRRIRLIPFAITIPEEKQDKELIGKLKEELPGILNWAIKGCLEWQKDGLGPPEEVKTATEEYRKESDVLASFLEESTSIDKEEMIKSSVLYSHYSDWCKENGEKIINRTAFGKSILEKGFDKIKMRTGIHYLGIKINAEK
ncbi:DNA primase [subsurface metagenome]